MASVDPRALHEAISATIGTAIISTDLDGQIASWNRAAERLAGYSAAEALGRAISTLLPTISEEGPTLLDRLRQGGPISEFDTVLRRRDGESVTVGLTIAPIRTGSGEMIGTAWMARELSGRHAGERAGRRLAAIIESSADAIVSKDLNGIVTSWNRAAEQMFGYSASEMVGASIRKIVPDDRQAEEEMVLTHIRAGEKVDHFETVRRRKDGTMVPISLTVSPIRDENGTVIGASKIAHDASERYRLLKVSQEAASVNEKLNQTGIVIASALDRATIVQAVTDAATDVTTAAFGAFFYNAVNESGEQYTLYTLSGASREAFAAFPMPRNTRVFEPTFRGTSIVRSDDITRDPRYGHNAPYFGMPPGHLPVRSYLAVPVKARGGEVLGGLFFGHGDVGRFTEQHERLAVGIAAWASVALENARLYADVEQAGRLKDEFLATLSHELRTPLNAILGYARMMKSGLVTKDKHGRAVDTIERNATSLTQIVEDVLDVSADRVGEDEAGHSAGQPGRDHRQCHRSGHASSASQGCSHGNGNRDAIGRRHRRSRSTPADHLESPDQRGQVHGPRGNGDDAARVVRRVGRCGGQ